MGLNNIAQQGWDYISNLAKNISVEGIQKGWNTYMVQSSDELANVARASMQRKNTVMNNLNMDDFNKYYNSADKSNAEFVTELNKLKTNLEYKNTDEAKTIATSISERFQDSKYLDLLNDAENNYKKFFFCYNYFQHRLIIIQSNLFLLMKQKKK